LPSLGPLGFGCKRPHLGFNLLERGLQFRFALPQRLAQYL
jgi:hypothetical protein